MQHVIRAPLSRCCAASRTALVRVGADSKDHPEKEERDDSDCDPQRGNPENEEEV